MYSLYRAWFGGAPEAETTGSGGYPALSPPDTVIRVGNDAEYHFVAHRSVLAAHSGYLKALLAAESVQEQTTPVVASITVPPTIAGGEAFAPLLNYMYTGHLEVTLDNIYTVLLATHLLHMPGALEQCRASLLRLRPPTTSSPPPPASSTSQQPSILRPVPNRLFCWPPQYPPRHLELPHLPSLSLLPTPLISHKTAVSSYKSKEASLSPSSSISQPRASSNSPELVVASSPSSPVRTRNPSPSAVSLSDGTSSEQPQAKRSKSGSRQRQNSRSGRSSLAEATTSGVATAGGSGNTAQLPGVVYDVACCDGPVKFHRVLNENYAPNSAQPQQRIILALQEEPPRENDENDSSPNNNNPEGRTYTCGYCRHTFKSQYCYRKHARRHLLPAERPQTPPPPPPPPPPPATTTSSESSSNKKREVRLLDLNVQYYPCKICGSKFPSYYFVHKHRKLCHANVDERTEEAKDQPGTSENNAASVQSNAT